MCGCHSELIKNEFVWEWGGMKEGKNFRIWETATVLSYKGLQLYLFF